MLKSMKFDAGTMFEKVLQTTQKTITHRVQLNTKTFTTNKNIDVGKQL